MSYTQQQIDDLRTAIASGHLKVKQADREVQYQSMDAMRNQLSIMESEAGTKPKRQPIIVRTNRFL